MTESTRCPIAPPEFTRLLRLDDDSVRRTPEHFEAVRRGSVDAPLGRAEGVIAFEVLLERLSNWTIADDLGGEDFERSSLLRGHRHLWIRW